MSKNRRVHAPQFKLFWLLAICIGAFLYFRLWAQPALPKTVPTLVSIRDLLDAPGEYHNAYVLLADGIVQEPLFVLERCIFWVDGPKAGASIIGISDHYRPAGMSLRNTVFHFEVLYGHDGQYVLLMREIKYPAK